jgi:hypothetical protein
MHRVTRGPICRDSERLDRPGAFVSTSGRGPQGEIPGDTLNECPPETAAPVCRNPIRAMRMTESAATGEVGKLPARGTYAGVHRWRNRPSCRRRIPPFRTCPIRGAC